MKGFKGFNKNLQCRDKQYEIGKDFEEPEAEVCNTGLHACENPLDVFSYYPPSKSRYCEVEASGEIDKSDEDSKFACTKLHIGVEVGLRGLIEAGVKFILDKIDWKNAKESNTGDCSAATNTGNQSAATNTGYQSAATNTGDCSAATNTGNQSAATNTGDCSAATNTGDCSAATNTGNQSAASVEGKESVAMATGYKGKAKGALGCWIVLGEWLEGEDDWHINDVKCAKVDGEKIKADTFYRLENGQFVEAEED